MDSLDPEAQPSSTPQLIKQTIILELNKQKGFILPLIPMNSTWFAKTAITTAFLGRLGELELAAGTLGFSYANVTGFSILYCLCWAMEPICSQAHGAKNRKLLHKTLFMSTILLVIVTLPISFLWLYMDRILILFGQQREIINIARRYVLYLFPNLIVTSFLSPLKAYLSSQGKTLPTMFSSAISLAFHIPFNIFLSKLKGIEGVALAMGLTDLTSTVMLAIYILTTEKEGITVGMCEQNPSEWARLLSLSVQCCFTGCLEWWYYEILILLTGRLPNPRQSVSILTVVLNFDYLLYAVLISISTCASIRVSNELGSGNAAAARIAGYVALGLSSITGSIGAVTMVALRGQWGCLFSKNGGVVEGVRKMLMVMALFEMFNFPLGVCGGILRGTSRPWTAMWSVWGYYLVGLPLAVVLGFKVGIGVCGLLVGFLAGCAASAGWLGVLVGRVDWGGEADKVKELANGRVEVGGR